MTPKGTSYMRFQPTAGGVKKLNLPEGVTAFRVVQGGMIDGFFLIDEETSTGDLGIPAADGDWILTHGRPVAFDGRNLSAVGSGIGEMRLALYSGATVALTPGAPAHDHATARFLRSETAVAVAAGGSTTLFSTADNELQSRFRQFDVRRSAGLYLSGVIHGTVAFNLFLESVYNGITVLIGSGIANANLGASGGFVYSLDRGFQVSAVTVDRRVNLPLVPTRLVLTTAADNAITYQLGLLSR
jgi:hypothetical protein